MSSIGSIHPIGRVQAPPSTGIGAGNAGGFVVIDKLPYSDIEYIKNDIQTSQQEEIETRKYRIALIRLFSMTLQFGIDVLPMPEYTPVLSHDPQQKVTIEASFQPPSPQAVHKNPAISLPISRHHDHCELRADVHGADAFAQNHVEQFVDQLLLDFSDAQILRLIIVTVHELGHFLSYQAGNHKNINLRMASQLFNKKLIDQMSSEHKKLIWLEECLAWAYGMQILSQIDFESPDEFDKVKIESLKAYFSVLKLKQLNIDTYLQMLNQPDYRQVIDLISPLLFGSTVAPQSTSPLQENHDIHFDLSRGKRIVPV